MITLKEVLKYLDSQSIEYIVHGKSDDMVFESISSYFNPENNSLCYYQGDDTHFTLAWGVTVLCKHKPEVLTLGSIAIEVKNPQLVFYKVAAKFFNTDDTYPLGYHHDSIFKRSSSPKIHERTYIGPFVVIEDDVIIEEGVIIKSNVHIYKGTTIKKNVIIESNTAIGATGVAWTWDEDGNKVSLPQIGGTIIEEDCFIGTNVTIVRGSLNENTTIGAGSMIAHGSKIGHGCQLGKKTHLANNVSLAGSVVLGDECFIGSGASVRPRVKIAEGVVLGTGTCVVKHIEEPKTVWVGVPAKNMGDSNYSGMPKPKN